ncbi:MAG: hypothetical protein JW895_14375 [Thermoleophilaceae bacterium]|nr:hypothetical protein [Thermoleophilaceae bacterium]
MNDFIQDIWNDLREKRLWPVAVLLLAGLIAVPVVLSKPAEEPTVAPVTASPEAKTEGVAKGLAALQVAKDEPGDGSTLDVFDPSDPFKPPKDIVAKSQESGDAGTGAASTQTDTGTGSTGQPASMGSTGGSGTTTAPTEMKIIKYRFVIDGSLTTNGKKKKFEGLKSIGLLPSENNPLLGFLGTGKNQDNAVFLVDTTLIPDADGDGKCKPSREKCAFLYLGPGETQRFTSAEGDTYKLRVSQIRKLVVSDDESSDKSSDTGDGATGATTAPAGHQFSSPLMTDLEAVQTGP